jgi:hypothetical protein
MEFVFISGLPCSGKSHLTKRLVEYLGRDVAARLPMDHYSLDAASPEHHDPEHMSGYQRNRIDWELLFSHLSQLASGLSIDTPRYCWETMRRLPQRSGIGRSRHLTPSSAVVFVDGMHPSMETPHKHVFVCPPDPLRDQFHQIRSTEMPLPDEYPRILRRIALSEYRNALAWLELNAWQKVNNPLSLDVSAFCHRCGWS